MQVRRIEVDVHVATELQRALQEGLHLRVQPMADAVFAPLSCALVAVSTKSCGGFSLDRGLQPLTHQFGDQFTGGAAAKQLRQLRGGRIRDGHGLVSGRW